MGVDIAPDEREKRVFVDRTGDGAGAVPDDGIHSFSLDNLVEKRRVGQQQGNERQPPEPVEQQVTGCIQVHCRHSQHRGKGEVECNV